MSDTEKAISLLKHAATFTATENEALFGILVGWFADEQEQGDRVWSFRSLQEHVESKLDEDPTKRSRSECRLLRLVTEAADKEQTKLDALVLKRKFNKVIQAELDALVEHISEELRKETP